MESILWSIRAATSVSPAEMFLGLLFVTLVTFCEFPVLLPYALLRRALSGDAARRPDPAQPLAVLTVIPSLLRKRDELTSMMSTVQSVATNGYPGSLTIVISIDGTSDAPALYAELAEWAKRQRWGDGTEVHVTGRPSRGGKPMAIHHALEFVSGLVADGSIPEFPPVYVSTDADADLGPRALEAIVTRLQRRNPITGAPPRAVAGALYVRGNTFWRGWRNFFTTEGQLTLQVAREYYVSNIGRHNIRLMPVSGIPGAFYCTWSEIFLQIPRYMGYLRTLRARHWLGWWVGVEPPRFRDSRAAPVPELVAGDTDDTVTAYAATLARYENGRFVLDMPRSPAHALYHMLRTLFVDRPLQFEPTAHVYTSSPATTKSLFRQRKRWNSARVELTGRLFRALPYHWGLGAPATAVVFFMARSVVLGAVAYFVVPVLLLRANLITAVVLGYGLQTLIAAVLTLIALIINDELRHWRIMVGLPLVPAYNFAFKWLPGAVGVASDVLMFGNVTGFTPEWTLKRGGSVRIALLFRLRRASALALRSIVRGDVPFGAFWFGWSETPWTPSGFEGWTSGKKAPPTLLPREEPLAIVRPRGWRRRADRPDTPDAGGHVVRS